DPEKNLIEKLGILGVEVTSAKPALASGLRVPAGVMVAGHTNNEADSPNARLLTADTIHAVNGEPVSSVDQLRRRLAGLKPRMPVVLQIERKGQFMFLAFELD